MGPIWPRRPRRPRAQEAGHFSVPLLCIARCTLASAQPFFLFLVCVCVCMHPPPPPFSPSASHVRPRGTGVSTGPARRRACGSARGCRGASALPGSLATPR